MLLEEGDYILTQEDMFEMARINKIINSVKATMAMEGLEASPEALEIGERYLNKEISIEEAIELIKKLHLPYDYKKTNKVIKEVSERTIEKLNQQKYKKEVTKNAENAKNFLNRIGANEI